LIKKLIKKVFDKLSGKPQDEKASQDQAVTKLPDPQKPTAQPESQKKQQQQRKPRPRKKWNLSSFEVLPEEGKTRFHDLDLPLPLMHAISDLGFQYCTPIQAEILPSTLAGKDASGRAQTGTGKTAAFLINVITKLHTKPIKGKRRSGVPRVLILAPTRELVLQIAKEARELTKYCHLKVVTVFGGMDYKKQKRQLSEGVVDIAVATPGRLLDFLRHKDINLRKIETLIIDEADRMLDMGFIPDVRKIIYSTPKKDNRQTLLFSATLTPEIRVCQPAGQRIRSVLKLNRNRLLWIRLIRLYILSQMKKSLHCFTMSSQEKNLPVLSSSVIAGTKPVILRKNFNDTE